MPAPRRSAKWPKTKAKGPASVGALPDHGSNNPRQENAVNKQQDTPASGGTASGEATPEWMAAMTFEPWVKDEDTPTPPSNKKWNELGAEYLPTVRIAYLSMFKTKEELVDMCRAEPEMFLKLVDNEEDISKWFQCFVDLLDGSKARYLCALAVVSEEGWPS